MSFNAVPWIGAPVRVEGRPGIVTNVKETELLPIRVLHPDGFESSYKLTSVEIEPCPDCLDPGSKTYGDQCAHRPYYIRADTGYTVPYSKAPVDTTCPECGEMMTSHVIVTRHATGSCDECFTGPTIPSRAEIHKPAPSHFERLPLVAVACKDTEGQVWSLPKPFRHHHVLKVMWDHGAKHAEDNHYSQGFLDEKGFYLHRKAALINAKKHNQIKGGKIIGGVLTSEDLW